MLSYSIIAVHGLGGHPQRSWTSASTGDQEECMWLRALLPKYIPSARIMVFTCESATNRSTNILSAKGIAQAADALLENYVPMRTDDEASLLPIDHILVELYNSC